MGDIGGDASDEPVSTVGNEDAAAKPKVVFVLDSMGDVRTVEMFAENFDLTVLTRSSLRQAVTWRAKNLPEERFIMLDSSRWWFPFSAARWLIGRRDSFDAVIVLDDLAGAFGGTLARPIMKRPLILMLLRTTEEYFRARRLGGQSGLRFWFGLSVVKVLIAVNHRVADYIAALSEYIASRAKGRRDKVRIALMFGVDPAFAPSASREEARKSLDIEERGSLILWRSRIAPEKDPDTFLRAMKVLRGEGREVLALYVGGEYRDFLALAKRYGVPTIARDAVHPRDLPYFYLAADVVVQTSHVEGHGWSPIEALACEIPVVASDTGGMPAFVIDGETGLLAPKGDADAVAGAVAWLLDHPDEAKEMARRGRRLVLERYSPEAAARSWQALVAEARRRP